MKMIPGSRMRHYAVRVGVFLVMAALIVGMAGCGPTQYNLTISSTEGGEVTTPGEGTFTYDEGAIVDLVAEADEGYQFVNWTGNVSAIADVYAASTAITMNGHYSITANFAIAIEIRDWYDLDAVRNNLGGSYILMNDLDSTTPGYDELASPTSNGGKGWQPIGSWDTTFTGSFDGQGYEICDLFINRPDEMYVGLFGIIGEGARIENMGVVTADVTGIEMVGALVGHNWRGTVNNCHATGTVVSPHTVGGLVGSNYGNISNSWSTCTVTCNEYVAGGLVGGNTDLATVNNCSSTGTVTGIRLIGGLVGNNDGTVSNSSASGTVVGITFSIGGLAGNNGHGTIINCYANSSVTGNEEVGGLVGYNHNTISNSYSTGNVAGSDKVGGLLGWNRDGTVSNSYSTASVTGDVCVGGLVGYNEDIVAASFWDIETSGQANSDGGTGKNTTEMQDIATFSGAGWDITEVSLNETNPAYVWNIVDGLTYPFLSWQS